MSEIKEKRSPNMDIIRCVALLCVVSVHFFLNNGFYDEPVVGRRMYIMVLMRTFFMICVPLFMVLTGYLSRGKTPTRRYYTKIVKTLTVYVLASLLCMLYRVVVQKQEFSLSGTIFGILDFSCAPYSWYVEMYIGLFLIAPFLNILYNNLGSGKDNDGGRKQKRLLVLILLFMTAAPSLFNVWGGTPDYYEPVPDWWTGIYPITYYFIGCYLSEFPLKIKKITNLAAIAVVFLIAGTFNYDRSFYSTFVQGIWQGWGGTAQVVQTVLVFNFLSQLKCEKMGERSRTVLKKLSDYCFGAYLLSWIFDRVFYSILNNHQPVMNYRLEYFVAVVPAVYICSLALSAVITEIYGFAESLISGKIKRRT